MKIKLVQEALVVEINRQLCVLEGNPHFILKPNGVASALHSAYYPGDYPFIHGGIGKHCWRTKLLFMSITRF